MVSLSNSNGFANLVRRFSVVWDGLDKRLFIAVIFICALGLLNIWGSSDNNALFKKQIAFDAAGFLLLLSAGFFDYRALRNHAFIPWLVWSLGVFLLLLTVFIGTKIKGASNWLFFGSLSIDPVEIVKLGALLVFARYFAREHKNLVFPRKLLFSAFVVLPPIAITFLQPDLGSASLLAILWFLIIVLLGAPAKLVSAIILIAAVFSFVGWHSILHPYQKERVLTFVYPNKDIGGAAYQSRQALVAVGNGSLWGKGFFAKDLASNLNFLPESSTDFAFASVVEKIGLIGGLILLSAFFFIFTRLVKLALSSSDNFSLAFTLGFFVLLASEVILNIATNLRLFPITGLSLPLVSYGGSQTLITFLSLALTQSIRLHEPLSNTKDTEKQFEFFVNENYGNK